MKITEIHAYQVYDSRGNPTIEAEITLSDGSKGKGIVPSGASIGSSEALELRDGDPARFRGKSVFRVIQNVNEIIAPDLIREEDVDQQSVDRLLIEMDGTVQKARLGANATLAVSMAFANAAAISRKVPLHTYLGDGTLLPLPEIQILGGGAHAGRRIDVQDFMIVAIGASSYDEVMEMTHNVYHATRDILRKSGRLFGLADEGGFWPEVASHAQAFELILEGIVDAGYRPGIDMGLSLDIAGTDLYDCQTGRYSFDSEKRSFDSAAFVDILNDWCKSYPILSIEDPMADSDWEGWQLFRTTAPRNLQIVGDDLFTTNTERIGKGIEQQIANAVLIKLNQVGTVSETLNAIRLTQSAGWNAIISGRSGETEDSFISHLAVATDAGQLKVGSFARSERLSKWNEVVRIAHELGPKARFTGRRVLNFDR